MTGSFTRLRYDGLTTNEKEAIMTDFTIADDFPRSEIEFDARFSNPDACYDYLLISNGPMDLPVSDAAMISTGSARESCTFAPTVSSRTL